MTKAEEIVQHLLEGDELRDYVLQPTDENRRALEPQVASSKTAAKALIRINREDPKWREGQRIQLPTTSFTREGNTVKSGKAIGHIGWKSSDKALIEIEAPSRGLDVDYSQFSVPFNASGEAETLVAGSYVVKAVTKIPEPGTSPAYGYLVPLYTLTEA